MINIIPKNITDYTELYNILKDINEDDLQEDLKIKVGGITHRIFKGSNDNKIVIHNASVDKYYNIYTLPIDKDIKKLYVKSPTIIDKQPINKPIISVDTFLECIEPLPKRNTFNQTLELDLEYTTIETNVAIIDLSKYSKLIKDRYDIDTKVYGKKYIIYEILDDRFLAQYKNNNTWYFVKGSYPAIGMYLSRGSKNLILTEGLKDCVNTYRIFDCDVLTVAGKGNSYRKIKNIDEYKKIYFFNDKDITYNDVNKMFKHIDKKLYKKIKVLNYDNSNIKDITDILVSFNVDKLNKRDRRYPFKLIKKYLSDDNLIVFKHKIVIDDIKILIKSKSDNELNIKRAIQNLIKIRKDFKNKDGVNNLISQAIDKVIYIHTNLSLDTRELILSDRYISEYNQNILDFIDDKSKRLKYLIAPTGSGKGYILKNILPKHYKKILVISPLRLVTDEHCLNSVFKNYKYTLSQNTIEDNYIAMTTDIFSAYIGGKHNKSYDFLKEIEDYLIIFDEQHLVNTSYNFRDKTVVLTNDVLTNNINNTVLFMSGTPTIDKNRKDISILKIIMKNENKNIMNYHSNIFKNHTELFKNIKSNIKKGSILLYVNSKDKLIDVNNLIKTIIDDNYIVKISSNGISYNGKDYSNIEKVEENINKNRIEKDIENEENKHIIYISTTKATTGLNFNRLKTIYQYGTIYDTDTLIQLMGRLRSGGNYYYIKPKYNIGRLELNELTTIAIANLFKNIDCNKFNIESLNDDNIYNTFKHYIQLPPIDDDEINKNTEFNTFISTYHKALNLLHGRKLIDFKKDTKTIYIKIRDWTNIIKELQNIDNINELKYLDRLVVDEVNNLALVDVITKQYSLSFKFNKIEIGDIKPIELITEEDKEIKKEINKSKKEVKDKFVNKIDDYFSKVGITYKILTKYFNDTQLNKLMSIKLDMKEFNEIVKRDKNRNDGYKNTIDYLHLELIPNKEIDNIIEDMLLSDFTIVNSKMISDKLQSIYISTHTKRSVYDDFIKRYIKNNYQHDIFEYKYKTYHKGKYYYHNIKVKRSKNKEFLQIKKDRINKLFKNIKDEYLDYNMARLEHDITNTTAESISFDDLEYMDKIIINKLQIVNNSSSINEIINNNKDVYILYDEAIKFNKYINNYELFKNNNYKLLIAL